MSYTHLTKHERYIINHLHLAGRTLTAIGKHLNRSTGTISRELRRNAAEGPDIYWDYRAQILADSRRTEGLEPYKLSAGPLLDEVQQRLLRGHSPQQISGRLKLEHPGDPAFSISHEAIYQWVYAQESPQWHLSLRKKQNHRFPQRRGQPSKQGQIIDRVGIEHRPVEVQDRARLGDWESDTLCGEPGTGGVAVHVERASRMLVAAKIKDRTADQFAGQTLAAFGRAGVPKTACLTLTADNGKEFAQFSKLEIGLGLKVYFAHPHAPWERGTNENTNGLIREYFPKGIDFRKITKSQVDNMTDSMNNRPRKCLGYQTPREVFEKLAGVALQN